MDAKYAVAAHALSERYFSQINRGIVFLQVLLTSGAVLAIAKQDTAWSVWTGILLALVSAYQQSSKPLAEAAKHGAARERFAQLVGKAEKVSLEQLDAKLADIGGKSPYIPTPIRFAAYNDNLLTNGRPDGLVPESLSIKLARVLVG